jgi:hypothetical protein
MSKAEVQIGIGGLSSREFTSAPNPRGFNEAGLLFFAFLEDPGGKGHGCLREKGEGRSDAA